MAAQPLPLQGRETLGRYFSIQPLRAAMPYQASAASTVPPRIAVFGFNYFTAFLLKIILVSPHFPEPQHRLHSYGGTQQQRHPTEPACAVGAALETADKTRYA
jgi:hypothetical protein